MLLIGFEAWSAQRQFGIKAKECCLLSMLDYCTDSYPYETGGILVGRYTNNLSCAVVHAISGPPPDSRHGRTSFWRGVFGLQEWLDDAWQDSKTFYIGEWHFHPYGQTSPSYLDIAQMNRIANANEYNCPEPILIIVGGNPPASYLITAFVFPKGQHHIKLSSFPFR